MGPFPGILDKRFQNTWVETLDTEDNLDVALAHRNLFATTESLSGSLTSSDSEDNVFIDPEAKINDENLHILRSEASRKGVRKRNKRPEETLQEIQLEPTSPVEVNNLVQLEVDLEAVAEMESYTQSVGNCVNQSVPLGNTSGTNLHNNDGRPRRKSRKEMDYYKFHNFEFNP